MIKKAIAIAFVMVSIASAALAEDVHSKGVMDIEAGLMFWTFVTFIVLLLLLRIFAWKPLIATLKQREDTIKDSIEEAKKAKEEAQSLVDEHKAKMAELEKSVEAALEKGKVQAEALGAEITEKAREEAVRIKEKAQTEIVRAKEEALLDVRNEVLGLSTTIASKVLARNLRPEDQNRIVDEVLAEAGREK